METPSVGMMSAIVSLSMTISIGPSVGVPRPLINIAFRMTSRPVLAAGQARRRNRRLGLTDGRLRGAVGPSGDTYERRADGDTNDQTKDDAGSPHTALRWQVVDGERTQAHYVPDRAGAKD